MENLQELRKILCEKVGMRPRYRIPKQWNLCGYESDEAVKDSDGELVADAARFFMEVIDHIASQKKAAGSLQPFCAHVIYGMLPRMLTAWDHEGTGNIEPGTFLKALCLLPYIQKLGADIVYLLPVNAVSDRYKKGTLGSPYAVYDFFALDAMLHDNLLGDDPAMLNMEFSAFVEAAHCLGLRVMVDFVFRTCARDNVLLREHPEWFYWIDVDKQTDFHPVSVPELPALSLPVRENLEKLYESAGLTEYVQQFRPNPQQVDPKKFDALLQEHVSQGGNETGFLAKIERAYGLTTAPAFSDVLNDAQPLWTDVTYLRMDLGQNKFAERAADPASAPYILNDGMKLSATPPQIPNEALGDLLCEIIPAFQRRYGIDGARIDMGHALPTKLFTRIIDTVRVQDAEFIIWNEAFHRADFPQAKEQGANWVTGLLWDDYIRRGQSDFNEHVLVPLAKDCLPCTAPLEMADTPRAAVQHPDEALRRELWIFNLLMPGVVPFINAGLELCEQQPMNLGLGESELGAFALDESDPMNGKLAFFDLVCLHWTQDYVDFLTHMQRAWTLREEFLPLLADKARFRLLKTEQTVSAFEYLDESGQPKLCIVYNRAETAPFDVRTIFQWGEYRRARIRYANGQFLYQDINHKTPSVSPGMLLVTEIL